MLDPNFVPPLVVAGGLLICAIALFWMWISQSKMKKRIGRLESYR